MPNRRRVDWNSLPLSDRQQPQTVDGRAPSEQLTLLTALDEMLACETADDTLRLAVEIARERIGFPRVSIYLRDEANGVMRGTWGTDFGGATVDEHLLSFALHQGERELYERAARNGVYWTVVENAPLVAHSHHNTRVEGRGWVCCIPIRSGVEPLGMMYNDAGTTGGELDSRKQAAGALLCSLLGTALELTRRRGQSLSSGQVPARSRAVVRATQLLANSPAMTAEALGLELRLSASRVARLFKAEMGMSLVEYRNRLRLERFTTLLDENGDNLLDAALTAGFGSYAQFHRAFLALRGTTPGQFLRARAGRQK